MSLPNPIRRKKAEYSFRPHSFLVMKDDEPWAIVRPLRSIAILSKIHRGTQLIWSTSLIPIRSGLEHQEDALRGLIRKVG